MASLHLGLCIRDGPFGSQCVRGEYPDLGGHQAMAPVYFGLEITGELSWALKTFPVPDLLTWIQSLLSLLLTPTLLSVWAPPSAAAAGGVDAAACPEQCKSSRNRCLLEK